MNKALYSFLILLGFTIPVPVFLTTGCQESPAAPQPITKLVITGSSTLAPLISDIVKRYEAFHPKIRIDVQTGGSSRGIADIRRGLAHIGMTSRALSPEEAQDLHHFTLAHDGIGMLIHASNPVVQVTEKDIIDIYRGRITNWKHLGGPDQPITVLNKAEGRATLTVFLEHFGLQNSDIHAQGIIGDNEQGIKLVVGNPGAIAYVSIGTAEYHIRQGSPLKLLSLKKAEFRNTIEHLTPISLTRPLNLITASQPSGLTKSFIDFAQSSDIQDIIAQHYFTPRNS
jgi:phosphate transport system substrate-binding protein